jgi:hypothetical protein
MMSAYAPAKVFGLLLVAAAHQHRGLREGRAADGGADTAAAVRQVLGYE